VAGPGWLTGSMAAAMLVTAAYCATRLVAARLWRRSTERASDVIHLLMGVAMAGMLVPRLNPLWFPAWEIIFGAAIAWFTWQAVLARRSPRTAARIGQTGAGPISAGPAGAGLTGAGLPTSAGHPGAGTADTGRTGAGQTGAGHHLAHILACGTMLYMLFAAASVRVSSASGGTGSGALSTAMPHPPALALILAVVMAGYVVRTTDRLTSLAPVRAARTTRLSATAGHPATARHSVAAHHPAGGPAPSASPDGPHDSTPGRPVRPPLSPRLAACCQIAMGITMGYMLIQML
jgi:hypothetical protein